MSVRAHLAFNSVIKAYMWACWVLFVPRLLNAVLEMKLMHSLGGCGWLVSQVGSHKLLLLLLVAGV